MSYATTRVATVVCQLGAAGACADMGLTDREVAMLALGMSVSDDAFQMVLDGHSEKRAAARVLACALGAVGELSEQIRAAREGVEDS